MGLPVLVNHSALVYAVLLWCCTDNILHAAGVDTTLDPIPFQIARWVVNGWPAVEKAGRMFNTQAVRDAYGRPVLLFRNEFALNQVLSEQAADLGELSPYALPPDT